ncbi:MAG: sodium:solute symporter family protein, partial [Schwartzia sp.]|nr:sodium:solute symporter family protein [Schwartzia sp. (in: firmicutes)]
FTLGMGIALIIMGILYARPMRGTGLVTISEYIEQNYGKRAEIFTSVCSSLGTLLSAVASSLPGIGIIAVLLDIPLAEAAIILLLLVAAYAFFGGMKSAGVGGMLKMAVLWLSLVIAGIAASHAIASDANIHAALEEPHWFDLLAKGANGTATQLLSLVVGTLCTQSYIQAIFSASSPRVASIGAFTAAAITIPIGLPCAMIGMYMHAVRPEVAPMLALPTYLLEHQPTLIGAVAMGGIVLSLISSIAGLTLGIGTMLSRDIFRRLLNITSDSGELRLTRVVVLCVIALALLIAIANEGSEVLFWNYLSMALRGGGIFLPLTVAVFRPRAVAPRWALISMIVSTSSAIAAALMGSPISPLIIGLAVSGALLAVGYRRD